MASEFEAASEAASESEASEDSVDVLRFEESDSVEEGVEARDCVGGLRASGVERC